MISRCSSVVEQCFCKALAVGSIPITGSCLLWKSRQTSLEAVWRLFLHGRQDVRIGVHRHADLFFYPSRVDTLSLDAERLLQL